ncbi:hypothetical protein R3W88_026406 [Solanum pinnatisectum]|uniref:DUF4283 domain-containing protein n=1 Tax=Solanum pinnatisectum TaxID=50273 RepID=A0AAV9LGX7_9SOLN|nr:hypothetical protein R3W88_026406 [Solanum pinnatisectum]
MIIKENLEFAVIGKFLYGWPEIQELQKLIPKQCEMRGECNIGLLSNRHVLIRTSCLEDYVSLLSKPAYYLSHRGWSYPIRTLKYDPMFDPKKETSRAIAWISFPALPPNFFIKEVVFSLAAAAEKPLQVDLATKNQTRPSCARVKMANENTVNTFDTLGKLDNEKDADPLQREGNRENNMGNEVGSTKKLVVEVFNDKERTEESLEGECIFKRLDRVLCNQEFEQIFPSSKVQHLIRQGSDHALLHLTCNSEDESIIRSVKFLNFWMKHPKFRTVVEENWKVDFKGSPFLEFQAKTFGDIFQQVQRLEEEIRMKEMQLEINPSPRNREELNKIEEELKKHRLIEEEFWKQKSGMKWFKDGNRNTKFFHNYVKWRRQKLLISEITTAQGDTVTGNENIGMEAVSFF